MSSSYGRMVVLSALALSFAILPAAPQATTPPPEPQPKGQVILSRSIDENGETTTQRGQSAQEPSVKMVDASLVEDVEREAVTVVGLDLDVHLHLAAQQIAVRALVTIQNDGKAPLARIPLQISSSLNWERIRLNGQDVTFQVATLNSDADHTGQLHEAAVALAQPLAPGKTLAFDVTYSGPIVQSAQRLQAIGAPDKAALHSDWDQIGPEFTGLRGFGNVVWYPVASLPVILGDGARLFDEIGRHKLRNYGAHFSIKLAVEFPHGQAPNVAIVNGQSLPFEVTEPNDLDQSKEVDGVATARLEGAILGFEAPSLFLATRTAHAAANLTAFTIPENQVAVEAWLSAAEAVKPFVEQWLGKQPQDQLTLLDLPDSEDQPFETGSLLAIPLREAEADKLQGILVHSLTRAFLHRSSAPPPAWLDQGVATFLGTLWVEKLHGREQALGTLEAERSALALAEPESPAKGDGRPLAQAISPVYYRTKAAYILWMLRNIVGDEALSAALRKYDPALDAGASPGSLLGTLSQHSGLERLLTENGYAGDLSWFFADWVYGDKGLPDIAIDGIFPTAASAGNWLVAVKLTNTGYAEASIPVTVRSADASVTHRVRVPARGNVTERILIQGKPTEVQANDGAVPETQASVHLTKLDKQAEDPAASSQSNPPQP